MPIIRLFYNILPRALCVVACLSTFADCRAQTASQAKTHTLRIDQTQFTIPAGMQLELVADESLTTWPMLADWDLQGRLLIVESGGVSKPIEEHNKQLLHRIVRLEDENGDGRFDKRTVVAKDLPFTEGVLCVGRDLLVTAPPNIYRLVDADHDGVFEGREVWFDGQTITGCANDLHGPYLGRDGWIYWCKGAFAEQQHEMLNGKQLTTSAAHIFRRKLSGGAIEPVMSGGMDNPVEVAITPEGERFFTSTFLHTPGKTPGLRDGIAHAIYGGLYGKDYTKVIAGHVRTGELMPVMVELGAAAPSGLICLQSNQLLPAVEPAEEDTEPQVSQRTLVAAQFNLQKVSAHQLQPAGASFTTINSNLVTADRIDFHPTDILEDADGSLLIVDTGGWYDLCCPSSRIDQKTAAGGIYRLSRLPDAQQAASTRPAYRAPHDRQAAGETAPGETAPGEPAELAQQLIDVRPWVNRRAVLRLIELKGLADEMHAKVSSMADELRQGINSSTLPLDQRLAFLWGLGVLGEAGSLPAIVDQLGSEQDSLVQAACQLLSLYRYTPARRPLEALLVHRNLQVRRAAAEALGRVGDMDSARKLLASLDSAAVGDRQLQHSVTYALIELSAIEGALDAFAPSVVDRSADQESKASVVDRPADQKSKALRYRCALLTLDQLKVADRLNADMHLANLNSTDAELRATVSRILAENPQWAADASYRQAMDHMFRQSEANPSQIDALRTIMAGWQDTPIVQQLMTEWLTEAGSTSVTKQSQLLQLLSAFAGSELPSAWSAPLTQWLSHVDEPRAVELGAGLAGLKFSVDDPLCRALEARAERSKSLTVRLSLLSALPPGSSIESEELEGSLLQALTEELPGLARDAFESEATPAIALNALQRVKLSVASGQSLLAGLAEQPSRQLPLVIEAISRIGQDELDRQLLQVLAELPAARTLAPEQLLNLYRSRSSELQQASKQTVELLSRADADVQQKVDEVLAQLTSGDPKRGMQLFRSSKLACSSCHRLGYVGGEIGPNLTQIGSSRTRSALLEAILFPNARLEQSYQPTKVLTHDGQVYNGLITRHLSPTQFEMQLSADKAVVLSTDDVAEQQTSQVSIMPSGLAELLTPQELSDLMAILESAK